MVLALRIRGAKPVNERKVNTQFGQQFDSARLHKTPSFGILGSVKKITGL
jgi:hypothetical protein